MTKRQAQNVARALRGDSTAFKLIPPKPGRYQVPGKPEQGWKVAVPIGGNGHAPSGTMVIGQNLVSYKYDLLWHTVTGEEPYDEYFFMPNDDIDEGEFPDENNDG